MSLFRNILIDKALNLNIPLTFEALENQCTVQLLQENSPDAINIYYKTKNSQFQTYNIGDVITLQNIGDTVSFYSDAQVFSWSSYKYRTDSDTYKYRHFNTNGLINLYGNIMSLINYRTNFLNKSITKSNDQEYEIGFYGLFKQTTIANIDKLILPAATLSDNCYERMFYNCNNLYSIPQKLFNHMTYFYYYSFRETFYNCENLTISNLYFNKTDYSQNYFNVAGLNEIIENQTINFIFKNGTYTITTN